MKSEKQCGYCERIFDNIRSHSYLQHIKVCRIYAKFLEKTSNGYSCLICLSRKSTYIYGMYEHIRKDHANDPNFKKHKEEIMNDNDQLKQSNITMNSNDSEMEDPLMENKDQNDSNQNMDGPSKLQPEFMEKTVYEKKLKNKLECDECFSKFASPNSFINHVKMVHRGQFRCKFCSETFERYNLYREHTLSKHKETMLPYIKGSLISKNI